MAIGVFLFFGSKDTKSAETIESFTRKFHVPYVCPCLTKVVDVKNNFQIHMKPPFTMAIVDMIRHYRWRNIIYLYDSTEGKYRELMRFVFFLNLRCLLALLKRVVSYIYFDRSPRFIVQDLHHLRKLL